MAGHQYEDRDYNGAAASLRKAIKTISSRSPRNRRQSLSVLVWRNRLTPSGVIVDIAPSGDVIHNDYFLYNEQGRFIAEFGKLTCKRIRFPELITKLVEEVDSPASCSATAGAATAESCSEAGDTPGSTAASSFVRHLRFERPVIVKMNGRTQRGVVVKPQ